MRKSTIFLMMYEIALYIAPLITAPYIARVLGPSGTGVYSYTYSIALYFVLFIQLGVSLYGRREIASKNDKDAISKTFWSIFYTNTFMFIIVSLIYVVATVFIFSQYKIPMICQYILLISAWLDISWLYFGLEKFKLAVSRNLIVKFLSMILVFLLIKESTDVIKYILIMSLSNLLSVLVIWINLKTYVNFKKINDTNIKKHFKQLWILFIPVISVQLYSITDKFCLGILNNVESVGIYENVFKISRVPVAIITAIGTVMLPRITKLIAQNKKENAIKYIDKTLSLTLIVAIGFAFGIISVAKPFVIIYLGKEFVDGIPILKILSLVLIIIAWGNVFRMQFILPNKMDNIYIKSVVMGAVINIILNLLLIPRYYGIGAAIASVISELIVCLYQSIKIKDYFNFFELLKCNSKYVLSGLIMFFSLYLIGKVVNFNIYIYLLFLVIVGVVIYSTCIIIFELIFGNRIFIGELKNLLRIFKRRTKNEN